MLYTKNTMGIPRYFSYIIKNHSNIIRNLRFHRQIAKTEFDRLYIDSNSIIYDIVRILESENEMGDEEEFESRVIESVIGRIREYIALIRPSKLAYIAFDGVAPLAKMDQQRSRRFKSAFLAKINFNNPASPFTPVENPVRKWDTAQITPGTPFMKKLSKRVREAFETPIEGVETVIVSASDERGEGEHKMFQHLCDNVDIDETIAVYGLDSDLIMLSVLHVFRCKSIHIFREAPEFNKKLLPAELHFETNEPLFIDAKQLAISILKEMNSKHTQDIKDYVFMCFFLGNDFIPAIVCLNIRSSGIELMLDVYRRTIANHPNRNLIKNWEIDWADVHIFISELAKYEEELLIHEYKRRNEAAARLMKEPSDEKKFERIGLIYRSEEKYINVLEKGWKERNVVCNVERYVLMIEWIKRYYSKCEKECVEVRNEESAPLLCSIEKGLKCIIEKGLKCIIEKGLKCKKGMKCIIEKSESEELITEEMQLKYIMPPSDINELTKIIRRDLHGLFKEYYHEMTLKPDLSFPPNLHL